MTVTYAYDELGRLTSVTRPDGEVISYDLSKMGDLEVLSIPTDTAATKDHVFTYDETHTVDTYTTPENAAAGDVYDTDLYDNGAMKRWTTPMNRVTEFYHDAGASGTINYSGSNPLAGAVATFVKGQLDTLDLPGTEGKITYTYVEENKPDVVSLDRNEDTIPEETVTFTYDGNVPTSVALGGTVNQTISSTFNDLDLSLATTTYAGVTDSFLYDDDGLLIGAGAYTIDREISAGVSNQTGWAENVSDGTVTITPTITQFGEVSNMYYEVGATNAADWDLTFDGRGQIDTKDDTVNGTTLSYVYTYDDLGQLTTVTDGVTTLESYTYDANGNRLTSWTTAQGTRAYFYDDDDRLTGYDTTGDSTPEVTFLYDKDGYLTSKTEGTDVTTYDYSSRGELLKVTFPDTSRVEYVHGVGGQRLARLTYNSSGVLQTSETEKYLWSGVKLLAIYDGSDVLQTRFDTGGGMTHNGTKYYLTYDQVGSLRAIYDALGVLQGEITYDSFGNELTNTIPASLDIPIGFAGGYSDRDTGLVRFGYRDYDPEIGRWTAKDPIFFDGGQDNLYVYVGNSPVMFVDPLGLRTGGEYYQNLFEEGFLAAVDSTLNSIQGLGTNFVDNYNDFIDAYENQDTLTGNTTLRGNFGFASISIDYNAMTGQGAVKLALNVRPTQPSISLSAEARIHDSVTCPPVDGPVFTATGPAGGTGFGFTGSYNPSVGTVKLGLSSSRGPSGNVRVPVKSYPFSF